MAEGRIDLLSVGWRSSGVIAKYTAVKLSDADTVVQVTAEGDLVIGIAQFGTTAAEVTSGKGGTIQVLGISLVVAGTGGVTFGTQVVSDGTGKAVASNSGARPLGIALATVLVNEYCPVMLTPGLPLIP